jgi:hypothetical protein
VAALTRWLKWLAELKPQATTPQNAEPIPASVTPLAVIRKVSTAASRSLAWCTAARRSELRRVIRAAPLVAGRASGRWRL